MLRGGAAAAERGLLVEKTAENSLGWKKLLSRGEGTAARRTGMGGRKLLSGRVLLLPFERSRGGGVGAAAECTRVKKQSSFNLFSNITVWEITLYCGNAGNSSHCGKVPPNP